MYLYPTMPEAPSVAGMTETVTTQRSAAPAIAAAAWGTWILWFLLTLSMAGIPRVVVMVIAAGVPLAAGVAAALGVRDVRRGASNMTLIASLGLLLFTGLPWVAILTGSH